jgi:hypothetical protein
MIEARGVEVFGPASLSRCRLLLEIQHCLQAFAPHRGPCRALHLGGEESIRTVCDVCLQLDTATTRLLVRLLPVPLLLPPLPPLPPLLLLLLPLPLLPLCFLRG